MLKEIGLEAEVSGVERFVARGMRFTAYNGKIADITETDTAKHTVDISAYVPGNCVAIVFGSRRIAGTGALRIYPNEGATALWMQTDMEISDVIAILNQRIEYSLSVANDDFDVYMFGYWTRN